MTIENNRECSHVPVRVLSVPEVCQYLGGCSRSHLDQLRKLPEFPTPISIGGQRIAFWVEELNEFLESRPRARLGGYRKGIGGHRPGRRAQENAEERSDSVISVQTGQAADGCVA